MKTAIIGSGAWATALGHVISKKGSLVTLIGREESQFDKKRNINVRYFPNIVLNPSISFTTDLKEGLKDADIVFFCVPSSVYRIKAREVASLLTKKVFVLSASKGFDPETSCLLLDVLKEEIPSSLSKGYVSLIGPSFAKEVIQDKVTTICAVSEDKEASSYVQREFSSPTFRIYTNEDEIGCQVASSLKNVIAIAGGAIYGLGEGENAKAGLVTRGLQEMIRLGVRLGGKSETFFGLTGIGDLLLTCSSLQSRNYAFGYEIGKRDDAKTLLLENHKTVEGISACKYAFQLSQRFQVDMPIVKSVYQVLFQGAKPSLCLKETMCRQLKSEH